MSDYIKREDVINLLNEMIEKLLPFETNEEGALMMARNAIVAEVPSADVEEVVRCRDCKYWHNPDCGQMMIKTTDDDYCSYGESKESEE